MGAVGEPFQAICCGPEKRCKTLGRRFGKVAFGSSVKANQEDVADRGRTAGTQIADIERQTRIFQRSTSAEVCVLAIELVVFEGYIDIFIAFGVPPGCALIDDLVFRAR